jgi:hypothetical protein
VNALPTNGIRRVPGGDRPTSPNSLAGGSGVAPTYRVITAGEVSEWFKHCKKPRPTEMTCSDVAARLTMMRWPSDPEDDPHLPRPLAEEKSPADEWWDFKASTGAADTLLASIPAMLVHWESLRSAPETRAGFEAISALRDALSLAQPFIEWPFGKYERQVGQKSLKIWHIPAVLIARIVAGALIESGHLTVAFTHNSTVVRVVHEALIRMQYPDMDMVSRNAIGAHLTRWVDKYWDGNKAHWLAL